MPDVRAVDEEPIVCPNCDGPHVETFCSRCGQRRPEDADWAMSALVRAAIERTLQWDSRLLGTLAALFRHPGQLTRDYFDGKRMRHVPPFQLFALANVAAWIVFPRAHVGGFDLKLAQKIALFRGFWSWALARREALSGMTHEQFLAHVDAEVASTNRLAVLCLVPLFGLGTTLILAQRRYRVVHHLTFSVHFYVVNLLSVMVAWGGVIVPLLRLARAHLTTWSFAPAMMSFLLEPWVQHLSIAPFLVPYLFIAIRRVYHLGAVDAGWRALLLALWAATLSRAFLDVGCAIVILSS